MQTVDIALRNNGVYLFAHDVIVLPYSTWPPYSNVCIVTTLAAILVGRLNKETEDSHGELHVKI